MAVYQSKGRWYFRFQIKGKQYNRAVPEATSKRDAEKAEIRFKSDLLQGKYNLVEGKGEMSFSKLIDVYIEYSKTNNLSWKGCVSRAEKLRGYFGKKKIGEISPIDIERYRTEQKRTPKINGAQRSNTTINREIEILRKMFNIAIDNNWLDNNPCSSRKVKKLREENKQERFLLPEEEERLIEACSGEHIYMKPVVICALNTGMRKGEILGMKWNCIDFKNGFITLLQTKSGKARKIPISSALMPELQELYENRNSDFVFSNPITQNGYYDLKRAFPSICKKAGIVRLRFHDLRHTAATRMVAAGIDLIVVKDILGHADISTTMRYAHPVPERKLMAVEALANFGKNNKILSLKNQDNIE